MGKLKAYQGKVQCPDSGKFCGTMEERCPYDCSGHGKCMGNGVCQCFKGFTGKDCNTYNGSKKQDDPFVTHYERGYGKHSNPTKEKKGDKRRKDSEGEPEGDDEEEEEEEEEKEDEKKDDDDEED